MVKIHSTRNTKLSKIPRASLSDKLVLMKHLLIKHSTKHIANIYKDDEFKRMEGKWYETLFDEYSAIFKLIRDIFGVKAALQALIVVKLC